MSFKHSAFIENTKEAREWVNSIGYKPAFSREGEDYEGYTLVTLEDEYHLITYSPSGKHISCQGNLELFKAITAIRDDSDIYQYFTDGEKWDRSDIVDYSLIRSYHEVIKGFDRGKLHKATVEELINHFKK